MRCAAITFLLLPISMVAAQPAFEVASVKVTTDRAPPFGSVTYGPNMLTMRGVSMWMAIRWGYGVTRFQMSAPEWNQTDPLHDILAKADRRPEVGGRVSLTFSIGSAIGLVNKQILFSAGSTKPPDISVAWGSAIRPASSKAGWLRDHIPWLPGEPVW